MVWYGMVWYGVGWHGMVWYSIVNAAQPITRPIRGSNKPTGLHLWHAQTFLQKELNDIDTVVKELGELRAAIGSLDAQSWYNHAYPFYFYVVSDRRNLHNQVCCKRYDILIVWALV